jgi:superfamily I DNA/RNA helicase
VIKPQAWRPSDGLTLEPNALLATQELTRSLALTAGPGAGKTEMLAQRADFLLRTGTCRYPQRILAISFKVDASRNLKDRVRKRCAPELAARLDSHTFHAFAKRIIDRFRPVLTGRDALDPDFTIGVGRVQGRQVEFADLLPLAVRILEASPIARNAVRQTYSHVFLDEFQDCTAEQYKLIKLAFLGSAVRLTAVGDTKQRIMGWAGALEGVFQAFATDFLAIPLNLYQNFRSKPRLRRMQNAMVRVMDPAAAAPDAALAGLGGSVDVLHCNDSVLEARGIADHIQHWISTEGLRPSEIAVLLSRQPDLYAELLMAELGARGIPFRNEQVLQELSVEPAARLIVDFLMVIAGERQPDAFGRLMDVLIATGIDEETAYDQRSRWLRFLEQSRRALLASQGQPLSAAALRAPALQFLNMLGREAVAALSADYERGSRLNEVVAQTFERITELLGDGTDVVRALSRFSEDSVVRIMTIHKCKGLEFDTVVMLGVEREAFWGNPDEQRSAFFVGISRAKSRLYLTVANRRGRPAAAGGRWDLVRRPHDEYLGYVTASAD